MNMTKKDYIIIAEAIAKTKDMVARVPGHYRARIAVSLAEALRADNPRFDEEKFFKACGVKIF